MITHVPFFSCQPNILPFNWHPLFLFPFHAMCTHNNQSSLLCACMHACLYLSIHPFKKIISSIQWVEPPITYNLHWTNCPSSSSSSRRRRRRGVALSQHVAKFLPEKCDFNLYKCFFMEWNGPNLFVAKFGLNYFLDDAHFGYITKSFFEKKNSEILIPE